MDIRIETENLILRNMHLNDVSQEYVNWLNNPEINKYLSCAVKYQTMKSCLDYVRLSLTKDKEQLTEAVERLKKLA